MTREHYLRILESAPASWLDSRAFVEVRPRSLLIGVPQTWREVYAARAHFLGLMRAVTR